MKLQDKVAIITGGAGGLGAGLSRALAKEGAVVVVVGMNLERGEKVVSELQQYSPQSSFIQADVSEHEKLKPLVDQVAEKYGRIDILINNAQGYNNLPFMETTPEILQLTMNTGFFATWYLTKAAIPYLKQTKGNIINLASGAGILGSAHHSAYASNKEAIRGFTRVIANEFGADGITANVISPIAENDALQKWAATQADGGLSGIPVGRFGDAEKDVGRAVVFLASEDSKYITGQTIMIDGGSSMLH